MCPILSYQNIATLTPVYNLTNIFCIPFHSVSSINNRVDHYYVTMFDNETKLVRS